MKKILRLITISVLFLAVCLLVSCSAGAGTPIGTEKETQKPVEQIPGALGIGIEEESGEIVPVYVLEDTDIDSYVIIRDDDASDELIELIKTFRESLINKIGSDFALSNTPQLAQKAIVINKDRSIRKNDISITSNDNFIYVKASSDEMLEVAMGVFLKNFVYAKNKSVLKPVGEGYVTKSEYYLDEVTIDGVPLYEFSVFSAPENESGFDYDRLHGYFTDALNKELYDATGFELERATAYTSGEHYFIVRGDSLDLDKYSITIENGNVYFTGSYTSVQRAAEVFVREMLGYTEGAEEKGKKISLSAADNREGSVDYSVPYDKEDLLAMFADAYERDDMILSGSHVWDSTAKFKAGNGTGIRYTEDAFANNGGVDVSAILELDVAKLSPLNPATEGEDVFLQFDRSKLVSEAMEHVSKGGIICICAHFVNPAYISEKGWYKGVLGDEKIREITVEGTELNKKFRESIESTLTLMKDLSDNGIPFMMRPFHEMTGDWFWWCLRAGDVSSEAFIDLWRYFYDIVTKALGITEVVWVYAPSTNSEANADILLAYPGDDYVDIVGMDWYTDGKLEYNAGNGWEKLMSTDKPVALTEFGPVQGGSVMIVNVDGRKEFLYNGIHMLEDFKTMLAQGHKIAYFSTWTWSRSCGQIENCDILMNDPIIYTRSDMLEYWKTH